MAWKPLDTAPNDCMAASILSLPNFCTSSNVFTIAPPFPAIRGRSLDDSELACQFLPLASQHIYCGAQNCQPKYCNAKSPIKWAAERLTLWQSPSPSVVACAAEETGGAA